MRALGLDLGNKTIGIAISDPLGYTAQGIKTLKRSNLKKDIEDLNEICIEYGVTEIVAGLPKNMNNTLGPQSEKVIYFCEKLAKSLQLPLKYWDERLTTVAANRSMLEANFSRQKRKDLVDKVAAVYILQSYLDSISK